MKVTLLLGSNLGEREEHIQTVVRLLQQKGMTIEKTSSIFITQAWGNTEQPDFYNCAVQVHTDLSAGELLDVILSAEQQMGRVRTVKWAERIIDIDIIYYGNEVIDTPSLVVPHPEMQNRRFVLVPLAEIDPDHIHPLLYKSNAELLELCHDPLEVYRKN